MQNSWLVFSHILCPPWPWTLRFRWPLFNHIPLHMAALAALPFPASAVAMQRAQPLSAGGEPHCTHRRSWHGACSEGLLGCTFNPVFSCSISLNESKLLCCCFSSGQPPRPPSPPPPVIALHGQSSVSQSTLWPKRPKDRLGRGSFLCHMGQVLRQTGGLLNGWEQPCPVTVQVLNKSLNTLRKATRWPRETVFHETHPAIPLRYRTGKEWAQPFSSWVPPTSFGARAQLFCLSFQKQSVLWVVSHMLHAIASKY